MTRTFLTTFLCCCLGVVAVAQQSPAVEEYILKYREAAISEMKRTGVPASVTLAQGIHESEAGQSDLVLRSNNHFGIKCKSDWTGETVSHDDDKRGECFRKYDSPLDSYRDHSDFLKQNRRYAFLFDLSPEDYEAWAYGLKKAGYATNPQYPRILIKLIEDYHLQDYTLVALGKMERDDVYVKNGNPWTGDDNSDLQKEPVETIGQATMKTIVFPSELNYPTGVFTINNTRVIFAKKGTSFLALALANDIPLARIFEFNEIPEAEQLPMDQLIFLQRKRKTGMHETHVVKEGETLNYIAQVEAVRVESLREYNFLGRNMQPASGEKLYLRAKAPQRPRLANDYAYGNQTNAN
jgi:Mannosyl-glycoprotein endo-beta-N-acetylglucosaminidase